MRFPGYLIYGMLLLTGDHLGRISRLDARPRQPGEQRSQDRARQSRRVPLPLWLLSTLRRRKVITWLTSIPRTSSTP